MTKSRWRGAQRHFEEQEWELEKLDPGWAKASLYFRSGTLHHYGHGEEAVRCTSLQDIAYALRGVKKRFEAGDAVELLHGIQICAEENLPLPTWLASAFTERFKSFATLSGPLSLDAVFGSLRPAKTLRQAADAKNDWVTGHLLFIEVHKHATEHTGMDSAVKAAIEEIRPGVKPTRAKELIADVESVYIDKDPGYVPLSRLWMKRRKRAK